MKSTDLRIGNYVLRQWMNPVSSNESPLPDGSTYKKCWSPCKIMSLGIEKVLWSFLDKNGNYKCDYEAIRPIPLTEDWLLRFGFETNAHFTVQKNYFKSLGRNRFLSISDVGTGNEIAFITEMEGKKVTDLVCVHNFDYDGRMHIHQLQNLFYYLCSQELALTEPAPPQSA